MTSHAVLLPRTEGLALPSVAGEGTFFSVQALRAVAAAMVLTLHTTLMMSDHLPPEGIAKFQGGAGVDIFFVISGFVMTMSSQPLRRLAHPMRTFLLKRMKRVVPMYWLATTVKLALLYVVPATGGVLAQGVWHIAASYLFITSIGPKGDALPVLIVGWTLNYEMVFYGIVAIGLGLRLRMMPFVPVVLVALSLVRLFVGGSWPAALLTVNPLLIEFLYGILIAQFASKLKATRLAQKIFWGAAVVAAMMVICMGPDENVRITRPLVWGAVGFAMVGAAVALEQDLRRWIPRWLLELGDSSYSLYLTHTITLAGIRVFLLHFRGLDRIGFAAEWVMAALVCLVVGELVYRWVELPITRALRGRQAPVTV